QPGVDGLAAPAASGALGWPALVGRHPPSATGLAGLRLEASALRAAPGPAPGPEDPTDSPAGQGVGATGGLAVRGRDRPAAVPAVAGLLGQTRRLGGGPPGRSERPAGGVRGAARGYGASPGAGTPAAARGRLSGLPGVGPRPFPSLGGMAAVGRRSEPHRPRL